MAIKKKEKSLVQFFACIIVTRRANEWNRFCLFLAWRPYAHLKYSHACDCHWWLYLLFLLNSHNPPMANTQHDSYRCSAWLGLMPMNCGLEWNRLSLWDEIYRGGEPRIHCVYQDLCERKCQSIWASVCVCVDWTMRCSQ